jgi:hypothetical protein
MKHLVITLWIVIFLGSTALTGDEYVTEEVCPAISGCWVDTKTGECPDCVMERREVTHTHEEEYKRKENFIPAKYSPVQLINYEECAQTGVNEHATRNYVGCEKYLKGRDWWIKHVSWAPDGY